MVQTRFAPWPAAVVEAVCRVLAATEWPGLTGTQIGRLLTSIKVTDVEATNTKKDRLGSALINRQRKDQASNCIIRFITEAMAVGRYLEDPDRFRALQQGLGPALSLVGYRVNDEGRVAPAIRTASTLDEVAELTGRLRNELTRRGVHAEALAYCRQELLRESTFHAVFEAVKGLGERLRQMLASGLDGAELIDYGFGAKQDPPRITINAYATKSEQSEHQGFAHLLKGIFGTFRNPQAHTPRDSWPVAEADALDLFSLLSYVHRRLDSAQASTTTPH